MMINAAICGGAGAYCSVQKGRDGTEGILLGVFLGPFGVIAAACLPDLRGSAAGAESYPDEEKAPRPLRGMTTARREPAAQASLADPGMTRLAPTAAQASHADSGMKIMRPSPGPAPVPAPEAISPELAAWRAARVEAERVAEQKAVAEAAARKAARRKEREQWYRSRGIEPNAWAWFRALPDLAQAIVLGLALATPAVILLVTLFQARW
jgi:hypothetical protein